MCVEESEPLNLTFVSEEESAIGKIVKRISDEYNIPWRLKLNDVLTLDDSVVVVVPRGERLVFEEILKACGALDEKTGSCCASYQLEVGGQLESFEKERVGESLAEWILTEYYHYGRCEITFDGMKGLSLEQLEEFAISLTQTLLDLRFRKKRIN